MQLKNVCTVDVARCTADSSIYEAARSMRERHVGTLVVVEDDEEIALPVGIVTDRDIVVDVIGRNLDPHTTKVSSVMSSPIVVADECEDVTEAVERMQIHGVRRIVVTGAQGSLAGIFTMDDLLRLNAEQAATPLSVLTKEQSRERRRRRGSSRGSKPSQRAGRPRPRARPPRAGNRQPHERARVARAQHARLPSRLER